MTKARQLADLGNVYDDGALSNRNLIINGAMQVAQRGTSVTSYSSGNGYYTLDRWKTNPVNAGTWTVSQDTDAPKGFASSLKWECTAATSTLTSNDNVTTNYLLEGQNLQQLVKGYSDALPVTLSFWVKSNKTGTYYCDFIDANNSRDLPISYTVNSAGVWEYKTITFAGDTSGVLSNDNQQSMRMTFWLAAGPDFQSGTTPSSWQANTSANRAVGQVNLADTIGNYWQITGVQLEVGDTATPFEHRSYGDELARCQRYYREDLGGGNLWYALQYTDTHKFFQMQHPVQMRATPTATINYSGGTWTDYLTDATHWKAYGASSYSDGGTYRITSFAFDAEL